MNEEKIVLPNTNRKVLIKLTGKEGQGMSSIGIKFAEEIREILEREKESLKRYKEWYAETGGKDFWERLK